MKTRSATRDAADLNFRSFKVRTKSLDENNRSIEAMIATETPVNEWDWQRGEVVPRVLVAEGAILPKSRQVPLLDAHNRYTTAAQQGSIRNLKVEANGVAGRLSFSSTAEDAWTKVREGHITDVSAGFAVLKEHYVPAGETRNFFGKTYTGPMNVATKWRLHEGSTVPIGADEQAKMRGYRIAGGKLVRESQNTVPPNAGKQDVSQEEVFRMNPELRKLCVERGMDEKFDDAKALEWLNANAARIAEKQAPPANTIVSKETHDTEALARAVSEKVVAEVERRQTLAEQAKREQREAFERDADATLELMFGSKEAVPADLRTLCFADGAMDKVRTRIADYRKANTERISGDFSSGIVQAGEAQRDKHRSALHSALLVRAYDLNGYGEAEKRLPSDKRAAGWENFRNIRLLDFARECLMADGYRYEELRGLTGEQIAKAAMGWPERIGLRHPCEVLGNRGHAYHTTGSLAYITLDAMHKVTTDGYNEAPSTWRGPMRQAASVPDFKNKHVVKFSAAGNLPIWQDNKSPNETAFANEKESYAVEARAEVASFSWQLYVNDDQDTLGRVPSLLGAAAKRTVNTVAWAQVTGNPTLADGQALFLANATGNRKRSNLTTGAATPSVSTLQTMTNKMMQMRGLNTPEGNESTDILNIMPVYIVGPTALRTTILQLIKSVADPASSNANVFNPVQGLIPVIEPLLDANSTTAWYLFASPSQVDTVEVSFLQGQETPVIDSYVDEATWCRKVMIVQSFAAKAIDHRGVQRHDGA